MKQVNMHDAKTHLSRYIAELEPGDKIVICNRNQPVAEIHPIAKPKRRPRMGVAKGKIPVPDSFFEPLPEDILKAFNGERSC
jgi:antitoxin (DNA-binding transcriptional repressor) of toxin-antitoxin stability system